MTNSRLTLAHHKRQETLLRETILAWTIARPVALQDHDQLGELVARYDRTPAPFCIDHRLLARLIAD